LRVLDVGTASGWFAFYFEQQGADVTAVDVRSDDDLERMDAGTSRSRPQPSPCDRPQTDDDGAAGTGITLRVGSAEV
jgi:hypothetical protein